MCSCILRTSPSVSVSSVPASLRGMETVVVVAIGVLAAVFVGALIALVMLCWQKLYKNGVFGLRLEKPDINLIEADAELELGDVCLHPGIKEILANEQWVDDATGLVPHTLAVLRACHKLTERLAALAMVPLTNHKTGSQIMDVARQISTRVDDVVRSMYPPLDPRLLEARTAALALAVTNLALVSRHGCSAGRHNFQRMDWIDHALASMESHLKILREAALSQEMSCRIQQTMPS
ncbi:Transmembrane protein 98 [Frankliniella fusca]|uniref:Transmembrane protein 98 n=1 Tax=Frankliniella fusca TaxID=407009 RepID=A0AAE1HHN9_9NEOP|nr:Transmembrane protein 98 [Frankliniella fusca]